MIYFLTLKGVKTMKFLEIIAILTITLQAGSVMAWGTSYNLAGEAGSHAATESNSMTWDKGSAYANSGAHNGSWAGASYNGGMIDTKAMTNGSSWGNSSNMGHTSSEQGGFAKSWGSFQIRGMR